MPKLDGTHLPQRLRERLADLRAGKEVAARDIKALLNDEQIEAMDAAWREQQELRKGKRARTKEEERALGWKSKREIHIEVYEQAVTAADDGLLQELDRLQMEATKRQMRIYMDTMAEASTAGKDKTTAENLANNALTRAGLRRMDAQQVLYRSKRDREIREMEQQIQQKLRNEMTPDELEQLEIWEEHEKAIRRKARKLDT